MAKKMIERSRQSGKRQRRPVIYIICEGSETEINYFKKFRTRYSKIDIYPVPAQHKSALSLVSHARDTIKNELFYPQDGDQLWCVFDRNGNTNEDLREAEKIALKRGYRIAFSNPAFELWFLLHFADQRAYLADADAVIRKLDWEGHLPNYTKSGDYYDTLLSKQHDAIERAVGLQKHHTEDGLPILHRDSNPCTTVDRLVQELHNRSMLSRL